MRIDVNFLAFQNQLRTKVDGRQRLIFDPIRKKYLVLAPEELVRQLVLLYLIQDRAFNKNHIRTEMGLKVNELAKRCDILIYRPDLTPLLLVECKAPKVKIDQATFDQIARYNLPLQVRYLLVTNGQQTYCCQMDYASQTYQFLSAIPHASGI